jgi:cbb3-type cytochrome oxidase maturation protein
MELILVLLPFALLFAGAALALFVWAARSGQFDDLETPAVRILFDDETPVPAHGPSGPGPTAAARDERAATSASAPDAGGPDKEKP